MSYSYKPYSIQLQSFYQRVDHNIWSYNTEAKLRFPSSTSLDVSFTKYVEELKTETVRMDYFTFYLNLGAFAAETNSIIDAGIGSWWSEKE